MMPNMPRRVLICVAIQMEADAIARALKDLKADFEVELKIVGIGGCRLPKELDATNLSLVISAGLAGALDPALRIGDVVIDRIYTSDCMVTTPAQTASLFVQTG